MKITKEWLTSHNACEDGVEFVTEKGLLGLDAAEFVEALINLKRMHWANWLIVRCLDRPNQLRYAVFAARDALVAKDHPAYKASLAAIEAAEACIENDTPENRQKANAARYFSFPLVHEDMAAWAAASAADSAASRAAEAAAWAAASAADSAAERAERAAWWASRAAEAAASAAELAAWWASRAADNYDAALRKYIRYGLKLLKEGGK